jgi:rod shape-determining protein MreD
MRWLAFFILAYICLGLNAGLARAMEWRSATPDFILLAAVFIAISAPHDTALLACFILGFLHDLSGEGTLGLLAFSYGIAAIFLVAGHHAVNRRNLVAQAALAAMAGFLIAIVVTIHNWLRAPMHIPASPMFLSAVYSGILAPVLIPILLRMQRLFRFQRSMRG